MRLDSEMPRYTGNVEQCVDALCENGCSRVYGYIRALQRGEELPEVAHLSVAERRLVLAQLVAIMAVYDGGSCGS